MPEPLAIFFLGLVYGLTMCSITCLPLVTPFLMGTGRGFGDGVRGSLAFLSGKLVSYAALGGIAAAFGRVLDLGEKQGLIMGITLIAAALLIPVAGRDGCKQKCGGKLARRLPLFFLGVATGLTPCPPLAALFLVAAQNGVVLYGVLYGLLYGVGLVVSPLLLAGGGLSLISRRIGEQIGMRMVYVRGLAMVVMVFMGVRVMV